MIPYYVPVLNKTYMVPASAFYSIIRQTDLKQLISNTEKNYECNSLRYNTANY